MFLNLQNLYIVINKFQEFGWRDWDLFLKEKCFARRNIDTTLFKRKKKKKINQSDMLMVQVYIEDIIFGLINVNMCKEFFNLIQSEFEMNMMEQLMFFLACKSNNILMVFSSVKKNMSKIFLRSSK